MSTSLSWILFLSFTLLSFAETQNRSSVAPIFDDFDPVVSHKKAFEKQLNAHGLDALFTKLDSNGLVDNDLILFLDDTEIDELCNDVKLSKVDIYKFKSIIRKMRHDNVIEVSTIEQRAFQNVAERLSDTTEIDNVLKTYTVQHIDQSVTNLKNEIDEQYKSIRQRLEAERKALHKKIDEWAAQKTKLLHSEVKDVTQYNDALQHFKREWIEEIKKNASITRQERDTRIVQNLSDILHAYGGKFMDKHRYVRHYAMSVTDNVRLHANTLCTQHIRVAFDPLSIPSYLEEPVLLETKSTGYRLALVWKVGGDGDCDDTRTQFRYRTVSSGNVTWNALHVSSEKLAMDACCVVHIDNWFAYNATYEFHILSMLDRSIQYALQSNIQAFALSNGTQSIELEYDSQLKNDDMILRFKSTRSLYLPTSFDIIGDKVLEMFIGNAEANEWLSLQLNAIIRNESSKHSFAVFVRNASLIKNNSYQHIRVRFNQSVAVDIDHRQFVRTSIAMSGVYIGELKPKTATQSTIPQQSSSFTLYNLFTAVIGVLIVLCLLNISTEFRHQKHVL